MVPVRSTFLLALLLSGSAGVTGCMAGAGRPGPDGFQPSSFAAPTVEVKNRGWTDFTIYLAQGSGRYRLGTVSGISDARVRLPPHLADGGMSVVLVAAEPGGGVEVWSPPFEVSPDRQVVWVLEADPQRSHLSIR